MTPDLEQKPAPFKAFQPTCADLSLMKHVSREMAAERMLGEDPGDMAARARQDAIVRWTVYGVGLVAAAIVFHAMFFSLGAR